MAYPVYTAAGAVQVLSQPGNARHQKARDAWLAYLRQRQLTEDLGWQPADKPYGGWGYAPRLPRKPRLGEPLPPLTESNLSATALRPGSTAGRRRARRTIRRCARRRYSSSACQNFDDDPATRDAALDDGGFFFIYDDPVRNKAGVAGKDRQGRERYASYGSTTADGLRSLLLCGQPADDPRVPRRERGWRRTSVATGIPASMPTIASTTAGPSISTTALRPPALLALGIQEVETSSGKFRWAAARSRTNW